uniref:PDZK1-interacting protein 1 n=1 Tax=Strix occidentalis caurina TaxID=311401 RepID=A0A8D0EQV7_STROC
MLRLAPGHPLLPTPHPDLAPRQSYVFLTLVLFFPAARGSLQPWSQGVIAVVVFLVLVAIAFVVNRFWCKEKVWECSSQVHYIHGKTSPKQFNLQSRPSQVSRRHEEELGEEGGSRAVAALSAWSPQHRRTRWP